MSAESTVDRKAQQKILDDAKKKGFEGTNPGIASTELLFDYKDGDCRLSQASWKIEVPKDKDKSYGTVYFDRKYCDQVEPTIQRLGSNNISECVNLIEQAEMAFHARAKELGKENKQFSFVPARGVNTGFSALWMINMCAPIQYPSTYHKSGPFPGMVHGLEDPAATSVD